jgi:hypothetical protein
MATGETSVAGAVFDVPELLGSILTHIDVADLIAARRVNKASYKLTETSPTLQRKLFLLPDNSAPDCLASPHNGSPEKLVIPPGSPSLEVLWCSTNIIARLNPCLTRDRSHFWECPSSPHDGLFGLLTLLNFTKVKTQIFNSEVWPEMYLTSPPCTGVIIRFQYTETFEGRHVPRSHISRSVYDSAGVTFATLREALHKEGDVVVCGDYKPVREASYDFQIATNTTVREQVDGHRRRGIRLSMCETQFALDSYSVTIMSADTGFEGRRCQSL